MAETPCQAKPTAVGNTTVYTGKGRRFIGAILNPAAAASTMIVYDGIDATGTVICKLVTPASSISVVFGDVDVYCALGIFVVMTGAASDGIVYYI